MKTEKQIRKRIAIQKELILHMVGAGLRVSLTTNKNQIAALEWVLKDE